MSGEKFSADWLRSIAGAIGIRQSALSLKWSGCTVVMLHRWVSSKAFFGVRILFLGLLFKFPSEYWRLFLLRIVWSVLWT